MSLMESIYSKLKKGADAPDFSLPGTDGKTYSLADFKGKPLLIVFMCNHCPYVRPKLAEINKIAQDYEGKINVIGINANDDLNYPDDSFDNMVAMVEEKGLVFPYLRDESQDVAREYGASCTPDPHLFNADHKLIFHSRLDDKHGEPEGNHEMHTAIGQLLEKGSIDITESPSLGCSVKWKK